MNNFQKTQTIFRREYILIIVFIVFFVIIYYFSIEKFEGSQNNEISKTKWSRNQCNYILSETILDSIKNNGLIESKTNWNLLFPCAYDDINAEINMMPVVNGAKYFILENCDEIVAKELLWKNVVSYFDYPIAKTMMPNGYILYDEIDINRFSSEYDPSKIYIMKKNIQRQEGLKITRDINEILNGFNEDGYVIVQELLQNPYIISGRKTNMRFYVLVVCSGNNMKVFVYKNGFMYYTKEMFKPGTTEDGPNITTGYIERQVYVDNPLTHDDLRKYLDDNNRSNLLEIEQHIRNQGIKISEVYFNRIYHLIREVFTAFQGKLSGSSKFNKTNTMFQLFGVDIAVDNKLNPTIMEVNKGPDLGAKDERDSAVKRGVVNDIFKIIGATPMNNCNETLFLKVLDITGGEIKTDTFN